MRRFWWAIAAALIAAAAMSVSACGDDDDDGGGGGSGKGSAELTVASAGPDNADPVLFQTVQAVQVFQLVYTPLVTYAHEEGEGGTEIIPGLAEEVPEPTNGGKTYEFTLRKGLEYSDGTPVKASDFENTMKRLLKLGSVWSSFYSGIVGVPEFQEAGDFGGDIKGIETDDASGKITINLTEPDTKVLFALAEPYTAPTPAAKSPGKSLKQPPPGVGPYTLDVVDFTRKWVLTKNPRFDLPGIPKAKFNKITVNVSDSVTKMTQDVINGDADFMTEDPTGDQLPEVRAKYKDRYSEAPNPPNTYYFFLNHKIPPFDKKEAREAVNYALDSRALVRIFGGRLTPGCTFLPPDLVGYKNYDCKYGDPNGPPDIAKAKQLVKESGYEGEKVTVWTNNKDPRPAIADYYRDVLNEIGFDADIKTLDQQVYFEQVGLERTKAQTGFTDWYQDYPHPGDFIDVLLSTDSLQTEVTNNQGFVSDPTLDKKLDELRPKTPEEAADEWGALDEYAVNDQAHVAPYGYEESSSFFSERMDAQNCSGVHPVYKNDWLLFCVKE
ncbi:MAG TPA: ABC transporter substrate-binding protein [Thermoleophilaceae bacterium]|nr:ABC transporter substrate-binding protein [Thermoleophilaceae bacterium]